MNIINNFKGIVACFSIMGMISIIMCFIILYNIRYIRFRWLRYVLITTVFFLIMNICYNSFTTNVNQFRKTSSCYIPFRFDRLSSMQVFQENRKYINKPLIYTSIQTKNDKCICKCILKEV